MTSSARPSDALHSVRSRALLALAMSLGLALAGCQTSQPGETTASLGDADRQRSPEAWGERYRANPNDAEAALHYARALRAHGLRAQAVAVLERAATQNPRDHGLLAAYGRALADAGHYRQALDVFERAQAPGQPDWRILSVQGAALDQLGRHEEAQRYYGTALRIAPDEPSVLSNLGLSYALSKDLVRAEGALRRAAGQSRVDARVRWNLALVVGLQGRFSEAERIARSDLPADARSADVAYLQQMLAQQNGWKQPRQIGRSAAKPKAGDLGGDDHPVTGTASAAAGTSVAGARPVAAKPKAVIRAMSSAARISDISPMSILFPGRMRVRRSSRAAAVDWRPHRREPPVLEQPSVKTWLTPRKQIGLMLRDRLPGPMELAQGAARRRERRRDRRGRGLPRR
jgi:Flp pilus assembly protein TadD